MKKRIASIVLLKNHPHIRSGLLFSLFLLFGTVDAFLESRVQWIGDLPVQWGLCGILAICLFGVSFATSQRKAAGETSRSRDPPD